MLTALVAFGRSDLVGAVPDDDDEPGDEERPAAAYSQPTEQAPPPAPSMPIGNRYVHAAPQNYPRFIPIDDRMMGSPRVLLGAQGA